MRQRHWTETETLDRDRDIGQRHWTETETLDRDIGQRHWTEILDRDRDRDIGRRQRQRHWTETETLDRDRDRRWAETETDVGKYPHNSRQSFLVSDSWLLQPQRSTMCGTLQSDC